MEEEVARLECRSDGTEVLRITYRFPLRVDLGRLTFIFR